MLRLLRFSLRLAARDSKEHTNCAAFFKPLRGEPSNDRREGTQSPQMKAALLPPRFLCCQP